MLLWYLGSWWPDARGKTWLAYCVEKFTLQKMDWHSFEFWTTPKKPWSLSNVCSPRFDLSHLFKGSCHDVIRCGFATRFMQSNGSSSAGLAHEFTYHICLCHRGRIQYCCIYFHACCGFVTGFYVTLNVSQMLMLI